MHHRNLSFVSVDANKLTKILCFVGKPTSDLTHHTFRHIWRNNNKKQPK